LYKLHYNSHVTCFPSRLLSLCPQAENKYKSHRCSKPLKHTHDDCDRMPEMSQDINSSLQHVALMSVYSRHCTVCIQTSCLKMLLLIPVRRLRRALNCFLVTFIVVEFLDISRNLSQPIFWLKFQTLTTQRLKPIKRVLPLDWVLRLDLFNVSIRGGSPLPHFTWRHRQIHLLESCGILIWDSGQGKKLQSQIWRHSR
jgi:hypothetical protein